MRAFDYTKLAQKQWDGEMLGYVAQIREHKGRQDLYLEQRPAELKRLIEIAKIQSTEASNKIEGIITTSSRIKQLVLDKTSPISRDEEEIMGYRDVLNTIHESYKYIQIKTSYILQLHRDLYQYSEKAIGGRLKSTQNYINEEREDGKTYTRFVPLAPYETPSAMDTICDSFNRVLDECAVEPLVLIPIFIIDFLCIHPFNDGNGRMSRLLTTLLLYKSGYVVGKYFSLESKIEKTKEKYYEVLEECSQGWHEGENDYEPFIKYMLGIILSAYRDFENRVDVVGNKMPAQDRVKKAIENKIGKFTKRDIMELCPNISKASVENALKDFINSGYIERHGEGRATFYVKKEQ